MSDGKRILICDDDPVCLRLLQLNLELEGYEVVLAFNGEQALGVADSAMPDLIVLDIMMPRLDGFQTAERLKGNQLTRDIPVVFLSTRSEASAIKRGLQLGADAYMTKPYDPSVLIKLIEWLLR